jgi:hypothetical protein
LTRTAECFDRVAEDYNRFRLRQEKAIEAMLSDLVSDRVAADRVPADL